MQLHSSASKIYIKCNSHGRVLFVIVKSYSVAIQYFNMFPVLHKPLKLVRVKFEYMI